MKNVKAGVNLTVSLFILTACAFITEDCFLTAHLAWAIKVTIIIATHLKKYRDEIRWYREAVVDAHFDSAKLLFVNSQYFKN